MYKKTENITIRVNPILKDKFFVSCWFLDISAVISQFMQDYVREYEKHIKDIKPIPVRTDLDWLYDLITKSYWIKITREKFDELKSLYPKTRINRYIYGDLD